MILIGSAAIKHWFPQFPREPKDRDYIYNSIDNGEIFSPGRCEFHTNPILSNYPGNVLPPDYLYTLKISHIFWDIKWEKHIFDIVWLKERGCKLIPDLFWRLYEYWETIHGKQKKSDLTLSAGDFFDNALKQYDHDYLHTLINPNPTYRKVLKDGCEVEPDEDKFNSLTFEEKLDLVREEIYVMAYERLAGRDYRSAYTWMLKKFIINHAPLWEGLFIIENYRKLVKCEVNYKEIFDKQLKLA